MKKVQIGDTVTVNYVGKLEDGSVFDTSLQEGREPLTSVLGKNQLIPGFENGLIDMVIGDKKTIEIESKDAYGDYNPILKTKVPLENVPQGLQVGETLQGMTPNGPINVVVVEVQNDGVILDANHPLAGKKLIFDLELLNVE